MSQTGYTERAKLSIQKSSNSRIFSANLEVIRGKLGLNKKAFAEFLGVNQNTITEWIACRTSPKLENLVVVARKTGWSIDRLVGHLPAGQEALEDLRAQMEPVYMALTNLLPERGGTTTCPQTVPNENDVDSGKTAGKKKRGKTTKGKTKRKP